MDVRIGPAQYCVKMAEMLAKWPRISKSTAAWVPGEWRQFQAENAAVPQYPTTKILEVERRNVAVLLCVGDDLRRYKTRRRSARRSHIFMLFVRAFVA